MKPKPPKNNKSVVILDGENTHCKLMQISVQKTEKCELELSQRDTNG